MNLALVHYAAPPVVGGVENVLFHQARQLARNGHYIQVIAGRGAAWDPAIPVRILPLADSRHPAILQVKTCLDRGKVPPEFAAIEEELYRSLSAILAGLEAVIVHNAASLHKNLPLTAALWRLSQEDGAPRFIVWHHDLAWNAPNYQAELHPGFPWDLLRIPWPGARQVTISEPRRTQLAALMRIPPETIAVIPGGVDLAEFLKLAPSTWHWMECLGLDSLSPLLLTPVRLTRRKNLEQAVRILAALRREMPQAGLVVTGPPGAHNPDNLAYHAELQALSRELGVQAWAHLLADDHPEGITDEEVADLYRLADALLLTSREEGFGIPVLEAGLAGLPVFCTGLPPLQALAGDEATYFSPDDPPEQVAKAIARRLTGDPVYRLRQRVRQGYTWQAIYTQRILPLLEDL